MESILIVIVILAAIYMIVTAFRNIVSLIKSESQEWRNTYQCVSLEVARINGSKSISTNAESSTGPTEEEPSVEQPSGPAVEKIIEPTDYASLLSKTSKTAVPFGEDVTN